MGHCHLPRRGEKGSKGNYEQWHADKLDNLEETNKLLKRHATKTDSKK